MTRRQQLKIAKSYCARAKKWSQTLCPLILAVNELLVRFVAIIEQFVCTMKLGISIILGAWTIRLLTRFVFAVMKFNGIIGIP